MKYRIINKLLLTAALVISIICLAGCSYGSDENSDKNKESKEEATEIEDSESTMETAGVPEAAVWKSTVDTTGMSDEEAAIAVVLEYAHEKYDLMFTIDESRTKAIESYEHKEFFEVYIFFENQTRNMIFIVRKGSNEIISSAGNSTKEREAITVAVNAAHKEFDEEYYIREEFAYIYDKNDSCYMIPIAADGAMFVPIYIVQKNTNKIVYSTKEEGYWGGILDDVYMPLITLEEQNTRENPTYTEAYYKIIEEYKNVYEEFSVINKGSTTADTERIIENYPDVNTEYILSADIPTAMRDTSDMKELKYFLKDLDNNGVPELFIATMLGEESQKEYTIYGIFTYIGGQAVDIKPDIGYRVLCYILNTGEIYEEAYGGAAYSAFTVYDCDGGRLLINNVIKQEEENWFHNGHIVTEEEASDIYLDLSDNIAELDWKSLKDFK